MEHPSDWWKPRHCWKNLIQMLLKCPSIGIHDGKKTQGMCSTTPKQWKLDVFPFQVIPERLQSVDGPKTGVHFVQ